MSVTAVNASFVVQFAIEDDDVSAVVDVVSHVLDIVDV